VGRSQLQAALDFMVAVRSRDVVSDRPLTLTTPDEELTLYFNARSWNDDILIMGVRDPSHAPMFARQISKELAPSLPPPEDWQAPPASIPTGRLSDVSTLDEYTRLNNELANLQRALAKKNAELTELNELKNQFLGMAAHDLRGSLWVIQLYCKILLQETALLLNSEQKEYLKTIRTTSEFMSKIVSDYLDITALESGRVVLHRRPEDLISIIEKSLKLNRIAADNKRLHLKLITEAAAVPIPLDAGKMLQVMNNLLSNAIKYSPPDTLIEIHVRHPSPERAMISVSDRGPGIPPDLRESIFEPFRRRDAESRPQKDSWGLGLAIVKKVIEAHGGIISVENREGSGSIFSVALPMDPEKPVPPV
jgi:signal transduction histidine kinase